MVVENRIRSWLGDCSSKSQACDSRFSVQRKQLRYAVMAPVSPTSHGRRYPCVGHPLLADLHQPAVTHAPSQVGDPLRTRKVRINRSIELSYVNHTIDRPSYS